MICDIAHAAQAITASPKPLILVDTCSLLDVVRAPVREKIKVHHIQGCVDMLARLAANDLHVAVTRTVKIEFDDHLQGTCDELEKHVEQLESKTANYIRASNVAGLSLKTPSSLGGTALSKKLSQLSTTLVDSAFVIERDRECGERAHDRVQIYQAPASRGKSESKDCLIVEHYLELVRRLRQSSYTEKVVFVTNNSNDYGPPNAPRPPLDQQFADAGITYCNDFSWAIAEVRKS